MADHEGVTTRAHFENPRRICWRVLCRCGWQSEWTEFAGEAEALHEAHVELIDATAEDFYG